MRRSGDPYVSRIEHHGDSALRIQGRQVFGRLRDWVLLVLLCEPSVLSLGTYNTFLPPSLSFPPTSLPVC